MNLKSVVKELQQEKKTLLTQLTRVNKAIRTLGQLSNSKGTHRRRFSKATRRKMAAAQKARWAKKKSAT